MPPDFVGASFVLAMLFALASGSSGPTSVVLEIVLERREVRFFAGRLGTVILAGRFTTGALEIRRLVTRRGGEGIGASVAESWSLGCKRVLRRLGARDAAFAWSRTTSKVSALLSGALRESFTESCKACKASNFFASSGLMANLAFRFRLSPIVRIGKYQGVGRLI